MANQQQEKKLKLTDTPNVAQVIRIVRGMQYEDRLHRRIWRRIRHWFISEPGEQETVETVEKASRSRKRIDAAGNVVEATDE